MVWRDQVVDFMKEIVKQPAVLVGNRYQIWSYWCVFVMFFQVQSHGMEFGDRCF